MKTGDVAESEWGGGAFQMEGTPEVGTRKRKEPVRWGSVSTCWGGRCGVGTVRGLYRAQGVGLVTIEKGHAGS